MTAAAAREYARIVDRTGQARRSGPAGDLSVLEGRDLAPTRRGCDSRALAMAHKRMTRSWKSACASM